MLTRLTTTRLAPLRPAPRTEVAPSASASNALTSSAVAWALGIFAVLAMAAPSPAAARGTKGFDQFTTVGTQWVFDFTTTESGGPEGHREIWKVARTERFGKATKTSLVLIEIDPNSGRRNDREIEYVVDGTKFYDIGRLERGRHTPNIEPDDLKDWIPLIDLAKLEKDATVIRYPDNPLAYVRYESLKEFKLPTGESYKDVIHATRNRGDTETTDEWWFSPSAGVLKVQLKLPVIAGGSQFTWVRNPKADKEVEAEKPDGSDE